MTIRKRLFISNLLMILVPVCIAALIAAGCVGAVWYTVRFGGGLGFDDSEDFYQVSTGIAKLAEQSLPDSNEQETLDSITALLDRKAVSLKIEQDGQPYYAYGTASPADDALSKAAALLGDDVRLSDGARSLYAHRVQIGGTDYRILIFGSTQQVSYTGLKLVAAAAVLLVLAAALAAVLLTNRFLTRFVFRRIEQPLALLADGVHQIRDGNLDFRITYDGKDEFAPVCADFNEMAERLRRSIEQTLRQEESRKELMASISHDLRSPLTSIKAYVEGLLDGVARTPEMQRRYLGTIKSKAEDIDRMVSQIFLFSKMELEEYPVHPEPLRLDEEVDSLMQSAAPEYRARGLEIRVQSAPVTVCAGHSLRRPGSAAAHPAQHHGQQPEIQKQTGRASGDHDAGIGRRLHAGADRRWPGCTGGGLRQAVRRVLPQRPCAQEPRGRQRSRACHCRHGGCAHGRQHSRAKRAGRRIVHHHHLARGGKSCSAF